MLRKHSNTKSNFMEIDMPSSNTRNRTKSIPILPPSPKVIKDVPMETEMGILNEPVRTRIQNANAMFDPNNASPASEFMSVLKLRMSVYYDQEIDMFIHQK